ncbi:MAG: hypothetical protein ACYS1A_13275 [Planctomycetota bacterium]
MRSLLCGLCITLLFFSGCGQRETTLEELTVPSESLPDGCELAPGTGLPFGPSNNPNPMITTVPKEIGALAVFVLEPDLNSQTASVPKGNAGMSQIKLMLDEWAVEQAARIEAAYVAGYHDKSHKETVVWALQFKDPKEAKSHFERLQLAKHKQYFIKDSILISLWTDNIDDPYCFDAVREYLE